MRVGVLLIAAVLAAMPAAAQSGRYQMQPTQDGVLRLDTHTGALALCTGRADDWRCTDVVPADGAAADATRPNESDAAIARLRAERDRLRAQLNEIARIAGASQAGAGSQSADRDAAQLDGAQLDGAALDGAQEAKREIDEALEVTDYALRRFRDLYRSFRTDADGQTGETGAEDDTAR